MLSDGYRTQLAELFRSPAEHVLCSSTTNGAIEEAAWAVDLARRIRGEELLLLVGGPHEDDCEEKAASR